MVSEAFEVKIETRAPRTSRRHHYLGSAKFSSPTNPNPQSGRGTASPPGTLVDSGNEPAPGRLQCGRPYGLHRSVAVLADLNLKAKQSRNLPHSIQTPREPRPTKQNRSENDDTEDAGSPTKRAVSNHPVPMISHKIRARKTMHCPPRCACKPSSYLLTLSVQSSQHSMP